MKKLALTNYYNFNKKENNDHVCPHCSRKIKKWALAQCSSCNRFFCRSHMEPSIGHNKKCPGCRKHQQDFVKSEPVFRAMKAAESKIKEFRLAESQEIEYALFASIFANKNLVKFALNNENEEPVEVSTAPEIDPSPLQVSPQEVQTNQSYNFDDIATALAQSIDEKLQEAGLEDKESIAAVLNAIFATDNYEKTITAQIETPKVADDSFKGNPMLDLAKSSLPYQPEYQPYGQLTPAEAQALDKIYSNYVSYYGTDFFIRLPEIPANLEENFRRKQILGSFINDVERISQNPAKIRSFFLKMGLNPDRIQIMLTRGY